MRFTSWKRGHNVCVESKPAFCGAPTVPLTVEMIARARAIRPATFASIDVTLRTLDIKNKALMAGMLAVFVRPGNQPIRALQSVEVLYLRLNTSVSP